MVDAHPSAKEQLPRPTHSLLSSSVVVLLVTPRPRSCAKMDLMDVSSLYQRKIISLLTGILPNKDLYVLM